MSMQVGDVSAVLRLVDQFSAPVRAAGVNFVDFKSLTAKQMAEIEESFVRMGNTFDITLAKMISGEYEYNAALKAQITATAQVQKAATDEKIALWRLEAHEMEAAQTEKIAMLKAEAVAWAMVAKEQEVASMAMSVSFKNFANLARTVGRDAANVGQSMTMAITAPIALIAGESMHLAAEFQSSMTKVQTMAGATAEEIAGLKDRVLSLAESTGVAATKLADALYPIETHGYRDADAMKILELAAKASMIGMGETDQVARALVTTMTAFKQNGLDAATAMDVLAAGVREGNVPIDSLTNGLSRVTPIAAAFGLTFQDVVAAIATFTRTGASAEMAATGLRSLLLNLEAPGKAAREEMGRLHTSVDELKASIATRGLAQTLVDLVGLMGNSTQEFHTLIPNVRALAEAMSVAKSQGEDYLGVSDRIVNSTGNFSKAVDVASQTLSVKWNQIVATFKNEGIRLGDELAKHADEFIAMIKRVTDKIAEWIDWFAKLSPAQQDFYIKIVATTAVMGPFLWAFGEFARLLGFIATLLSVITGSSLFGWFTSILAKTAAWAVAIKDFGWAAFELAGTRAIGGVLGAIEKLMAAPVVVAFMASFEYLSKMMNAVMNGKSLDSLKTDIAGVLGKSGGSVSLPHFETSTGVSAAMPPNTGLPNVPGIKSGQSIIDAIYAKTGLGNVKGGGDSAEVAALTKQYQALIQLAPGILDFYKSLSPAQRESAAAIETILPKLETYVKYGGQIPPMLQAWYLSHSKVYGKLLDNIEKYEAGTLSAVQFSNKYLMKAVDGDEAMLVSITKLWDKINHFESGGSPFSVAALTAGEKFNEKEILGPMNNIMKAMDDLSNSDKDFTIQSAQRWNDYARKLRKAMEDEHFDLDTINHVIDELKKKEPTLTVAFQKMSAAFQNMGQVAALTGNTLAAKWAQVGAGLSDTFAKIAQKGASTTDKLIAAFQGAANAIAQMFGGTQAGRGASGALSGAATGMAVGSIFGPWGTAIGGVIGGVAGLISGLQSAGKQVNDLRDAFFAQAGGFVALHAALIDAGNEAAFYEMWNAKNTNEWDQALKDVNATLDAQKTKLANIATINQNIADAQAKISDLAAASIPTWDKVSAILDKYNIKVFAPTVDANGKQILDPNDLGKDAGAAIQQMSANNTALGLLDDWKVAQQAGVSTNAMIKGMAPQISAFVNSALEQGFKLPSNIEDLVKLVASNNLLLDTHGKAITDLSNLDFSGTPVVTSVDANTNAIQALTNTIDDLNAQLQALTNPSATTGGTAGAYVVPAGGSSFASTVAGAAASSAGRSASGDSTYSVNLIADGQSLTTLVLKTLGGKLISVGY